MKYFVRHQTWYSYAAAAPVCQNLVHLAPRITTRQTILAHELRIEPTPTWIDRREDYFGNRVDYFSVEATHHRLEVIAESEVEIIPRSAGTLGGAPTWEEAAAHAHTDGAVGDGMRDPPVAQMTFGSPRAPISPQIRQYAEESFPAGRGIVEAVVDLMGRIFCDFQFDPRATTVHTPVTESLQLRRGVCQDFAHVAISGLRSMGVAARYVSGYLRTNPPPGGPRLIGADASHAWGAAYCGPLGWIDFDPTNNVLVGEDHVTIAWGRDYGDVAPIQGVFVGGGDHSMGVSVDVVPVGSADHATLVDARNGAG